MLLMYQNIAQPHETLQPKNQKVVSPRSRLTSSRRQADDRVQVNFFTHNTRQKKVVRGANTRKNSDLLDNKTQSR